MRRQTNIILHIFYWLYFSVVRELASQYFIKGGIQWTNFLSILSVSSLIVFGGIFYTNYLIILPRFFAKRKFYYIGISWIAAILFFTLLRYLTEEILFFKLFGATNYFKGTTAVYYLYDNYIFLFDQLIISTVFWAVNHLVKNEKERKILLQEKFTAETAFLKSQVNPHFLFNTLNNIYSLVYQKSEQALPAILKLSELMRYNMKDSQTDKIELSKEIPLI